MTILGAGLSGALLSTLLAQRNYSAQLYEKRADPREYGLEEGRSINLALSHRGWQALGGCPVGICADAHRIFDQAACGAFSHLAA